MYDNIFQPDYTHFYEYLDTILSFHMLELTLGFALGVGSHLFFDYVQSCGTRSGYSGLGIAVKMVRLAGENNYPIH